MFDRPRRNRASARFRAITRETELRPERLIWPLFVEDGQGIETPIASLPGQSRLSIDRLLVKAHQAHNLGIAGVALFPRIPEHQKDSSGTESTNPDGLIPRTVRALKRAIPELLVVTDVALDPYSSDGHDGLVVGGKIDNDLSLPLLTQMATVQAEAGADVVAPSDMMDGRVGAIRKGLDDAGHSGVAICSYCVKYASAFYGPFRDALDSAPRSGDKLTYQMDPSNVREAEREVRLDMAEGADWLMVKPGLPYLDVLRRVRELTPLPVAAYQVSGEYAMLKAASSFGWLDYEACLLESLISMRRAGADVIFTYAALDAAELLRSR